MPARGCVLQTFLSLLMQQPAVGLLPSTDFKVRLNSWEISRSPAGCRLIGNEHGAQRSTTTGVASQANCKDKQTRKRGRANAAPTCKFVVRRSIKHAGHTELPENTSALAQLQGVVAGAWKKTSKGHRGPPKSSRHVAAQQFAHRTVRHCSHAIPFNCSAPGGAQLQTLAPQFTSQGD